MDRKQHRATWRMTGLEARKTTTATAPAAMDARQLASWIELGAGPCTDGTQCASGVCNTLAAAPVCAVSIGCGNGVVDLGEACDDGNQVGGDGCAESCNLENGWRGGGGCAASAPSDSPGQGELLGLLIVGLLNWRRRRPMCKV